MLWNISNVFADMLDELEEGTTVNQVFDDFVDGDYN